MADALEQTKDLFSVDDFNEDDISTKSKIIKALDNPAFGEFRPKEEIIEKAKATGTGLLTGTLGIPSDVATLASAVSSGMAKYADSPTAMMLKDVLKKAEKDVGRPAFDKWFTETTGLESNPENVDQLVGEVLSPTGAFLAPVKTLKNIFAPLKKGVTNFFDKMPPPNSGLAVETAGVGQLDQTKKLLDKENISKPIKTNIPALPSADDLANKPTINPTIIGTQTEAGKKAEDIYDDLVAKGVTDPKEIFKKTGGGYVGRDGKFRFDLDDRDAKLKVNPDELEFDVDYQNMSSSKDMLETKTVTLGNILDFDSLYKQYYKNINVSGKNYQALRNVKVVFNYGEPAKGTLGSYSPSEDRIILHMKNLSSPFRKGQEQEDYIMSTLIHEVQHAVQRREGFISGANSDDTKDIVLDAINEDGVYKLPLGSDKKEITTPYMSGISRYNTDSAYSAYLEADLLSNAIKNNTNTDKLIHLADNISDNVPDFTGDRKIEFIKNYEILLDSKNKLKTELEKYNTKQKKFVKDLNIPGAEVLGTGKESKGSVPLIAVDIFPADFNKAKSAFGFKDKDKFANFVFEDLKSLDDLKGFVDRAYNRARVNIDLDDKSLAKLETEQARRLKNDEALLNFKGEVDREAKRLYRDEYGEMEARLVEQRYARRQELRRDPMLLTDEQITEKMLDDTGAIFREPDEYGRTTKILGGFNKNSYVPNKQMYDNVQESVIEFPQNPSKAKKKFDLQKIEKKQADARKLEDKQLKIQNMKIVEAHAPMVKLLGAEETTKVANNPPTLNADGTGFTENSLVFKNLSDRYTEEALSVVNPEITWIRIPEIYKQKPFQKYKDGDVLRNAEGKTLKIELTSFLPVTDKKLYNNPNVVNVSALGRNVNKKQYHVEPAYILGDGKYVRLTDLERVGYKRVGKPDLSIISDTKITPTNFNSTIKKIESNNNKLDNPVFKRISEITKLQDGPLGSRTPMDKDGLPKNLLRDKDGKPLVLYYGDMGQVYDPKTQTYTPSDIPGKLKNKFEPSGRTYTTDRKVGNFVTPNPVFASGYASREGGSVIPVYLIADKVTNIKASSFSDIDKAGGDAKRGEVFIGDVGYDSAPPVKLVNGREVKDLELRDESVKKYGTEQYTFNRGTQVFSAITGERLTELPTINQNIRNKLLNLTQKEEDIALKNMSPEERIKYKAEKTYTEDLVDDTDFVEDMFKSDRKGDIERNERKRNLAKGGDMNKQMEMFEDGGLKQEGGTIDPVSGNDVPPGSTQEEVRDDIPAQLSEGEFVFPADVVRYIGLEKLMRLRQEAKQGLKMMEEMGQMGNSEEATMPDDLPFDETDLDIEAEEEYNNDTQEMNQGGMVRVGGMEMPRPIIAGQQMAEGGVVKAQSGTFVNPGTGVTTIPSQFAGQNLPSYNPNQTYQAFTRPSYTVPTIPGQTTGGYRPVFYGKPPADSKGITTPTFENLLGRNPGQYDEFREYRNDAGFTLRIPFRNGQPIYPIPEGFRFVDPEKEETETTTTQTTQTGTTQVSGDGGDDSGSRVGTTMVGKTGIGITDKSLSTAQKTANVVNALQQNTPKSTLGKAIEAGAKGLLGAMMPGVGLLGGAALGAKSFYSPSGTSTQGLESIGFTTDTAQGIGYDAQGNVTVSGPMASVMGIDAVMDTLSQQAYGMSYAEATKAFGAAPTFSPGYKNGQVDPTTGATYAYGQATDDDGNVSYGSIDDFGIGVAAMSATGFMGGMKDAERVSKTGKTKEARQKAKNYMSFVRARTKQKEQDKKDEEAAERGGTGDLGGVGDLGSGYGIGESTGTGSQTVGTEDVDPTGGGTSTGPGATAGGPTEASGDLGGAGDQSSSDGSSSSPGGATEGVGDYNTGGLARKRKPKVKRMKRGGLASKK